jgi:hypothetical protein
LKERGFEVSSINVGSSVQGEPTNRDKYANLKAQLYWNLRETFRSGAISGVRDETLIGQLASLRYEEDLQGRIRIETKDSLRKRGVPSPDRAEALMLCFAEIEPATTRTYYPVLLTGSVRDSWHAPGDFGGRHKKDHHRVELPGQGQPAFMIP